MAHDQDAPSLTTLIRRVRRELLEASYDVQANGQEPVLQLGKVKLEVKLIVTDDETAGGKFDLKVVSVGGKKRYTAEQVQTVTIELDPIEQENVVPRSSEDPHKLVRSTRGGGGGSRLKFK